jgi:hypothetical protein
VRNDAIAISQQIYRYGQMFGRVLKASGGFDPIDCISVAGDDLHFWYADAGTIELPSFVASHAQAFDDGTIERFCRLSFAVIGASGTGSPTVEQLMRLGALLILNVDDDHMEERNVNRIINSTMDDVRNGRAKVDVLADAVERAGIGAKLVPLKKNLWDAEVIREVAQCNVIIGCMDTVDGRYLLNDISAYYSIPYFDIGVRLDAIKSPSGKTTIREVCGTINYLRPGRSSLVSRELFTMNDVRDAWNGVGHNSIHGLKPGASSQRR